MKKVSASYTAQQLAAARRVYCDEIARRIVSEENDSAIYTSVFRAAQRSGMRVKDVFTLIGGRAGAFSIAAREFRAQTGCPLAGCI